MAVGASSGAVPGSLRAVSLLLLLLLPPPWPALAAAAPARSDELPPYPADVVHKPDPSYCLSPVNLSFYKSLRQYEFETSADAREPQAMRVIYAYGRFIASIFVPARVPKVLLSEKMLTDPASHLKENILPLVLEFPSLLLLVGVCAVLVVAVPVWPFCRSRPGKGSGAREEGEWKRLAYAAGLVFCCVIMLVTALFTLLAFLHVPLGASNIVPQSRRIIRDITLFFDKTKQEIDILLVRDYSVFETDFYKRMDSCVAKVGEDFKGIVGESPIEGVQKVVRQMARIDECLKEATAAMADLSATIRRLREGRVGIHTRIAAAVAECWSRAPPPPYCTELNKTFDLVPSQAVSPDEIYLGGLRRFMAKLDVVLPSALVRDVDEAAQLPLSTEGVRQALSTEAKDIKLEVEYFGSDLMDLVERFAASWARQPDALNLKVSRRYGDYVGLVEPFAGLNSLVAVGISSVFFLIVTFYSTGVALFNWPGHTGNRRIKSSWCLFLGAHVFLLPFVVGMVLTILGVITGFTLQRCVCDVVADPTTPAFKDVIRFGMKVAREWEIVNGTRQALSHVSADTVQDIFKRFVRCREQPLSLYKLLGDQLMRNISGSVGSDWAFSWLWSDGPDALLTEKLAHFAEPKAPLVPKGAPVLTDLESKMNDVQSVRFRDLHVASYLRDVDSLSFNTDAFVRLSTKLTDIRQSAQDTTMKQKVSDILQQVQKTMDEYAEGEPKKKQLVQILEEIVALKMVEGKSIDEYNREKAANLASRTTSLWPALTRVLGGSGRYKQQMSQLVGTYMSHMAKAVKEDVGRCGPAYAIYESALNTVCLDLVAPYNSMWACLLTYLLVGVVALVLALSLSTLYMRAAEAPVQPATVAGVAATPHQEPGPGGDGEAAPGTVALGADRPTASLAGGQAEHPARHVVTASAGEDTSSGSSEETVPHPTAGQLQTGARANEHQRKPSANASMSPGLLSPESDDNLLVRPFTCGIDSSRHPTLASPGEGRSPSRR
ncbi:uncharacterized protein [Dermacentor albipictus]|uniref:uncharacterized protein n=1 Tax=Dermacentor albipictus TaxID=60249 RepID=UPI0038FC17C9